jgi:hypothetical protein
MSPKQSHFRSTVNSKRNGLFRDTTHTWFRKLNKVYDETGEVRFMLHAKRRFRIIWHKLNVVPSPQIGSAFPYVSGFWGLNTVSY